jgi:ubiquinone/menaquinone biosynthesis C-methylase UbiE
MNTSISRVPRPRTQAQVTYDRLSRWYDALAGSSEKRFLDLGLQKLAVREGECVLEIGPGTGHAVLTLAQSVGDSGKVYGIDLSRGMLEIAQARVNKAGLAARAALTCGDATNLPFEDQSFDVIFMSFTLELFDTGEIPIVLQESRKVLRPAGRIGIVALSKSQPEGLIVKLYEWLHRRLPNVVDCRPIFVQDSLRAAGFQVIDVTRMLMWGLPVEIVVANKSVC